MATNVRNFIRIPFLAESLVKVKNEASLSSEVKIPISGAEIKATPKSSQGSSTIFENNEGKALGGLALSNSEGEFPYFLEEGSYRLEITKSGLATKTIEWEAVSHYQSEVPPGTIVAYAGSVAPYGWLLCEGQKYKSSEYPALYEVTKTTYGGSAEEPLLPDLRGRGVFGPTGSSSRLPEHGALAESGGSETVKLTTGQLAAHAHSIGAPYTTAAGGVTYGSGIPPHNGEPSGGDWSNGTVSTGGGEAHNNMPPYLVLSWIIKC